MLNVLPKNLPIEQDTELHLPLEDLPSYREFFWPDNDLLEVAEDLQVVMEVNHFHWDDLNLFVFAFLFCPASLSSLQILGVSSVFSLLFFQSGAHLIFLRHLEVPFQNFADFKRFHQPLNHLEWTFSLLVEII